MRACCQLIRSVATHTILGNHDAAVAERTVINSTDLLHVEALDGHRTMLSQESIEWLKSLPYIAHQEEASFCHASPVDYTTFKYIFGTEHIAPLVEAYSEQPFVTFIGHSICVNVFTTVLKVPEEILNTRFHLKLPGYRFVITVGSVGQPRDRKSSSMR